MIYRYRCSAAECAAQSELVQSIKLDVPDSIPCQFCTAQADKIIEAPAVLTGSMGNQPYDVSIGRISEARHEAIQERQAQRDKVRRASNQVGIRARSHNDFQPITRDEQKRRQQAMDSVEKSGSFKPTYDGDDGKLVG